MMTDQNRPAYSDGEFGEAKEQTNFCPRCSRIFTTSSRLEKHLEQACNKDNDFKCPVGGCTEAFKWKQFLDKHMWKKHPKFARPDPTNGLTEAEDQERVKIEEEILAEAGRPYACPCCLMECFSRISLRNEHIREEHPGYDISRYEYDEEDE